MAVTCLVSARTFAPLTRRLSLACLRSRKTSEHPQLSTGPGRVHPRVITVDGLTLLSLTSACTCRIRIQGRPFPTSKSTTICSLFLYSIQLEYLYCTNPVFSSMWCTFFHPPTLHIQDTVHPPMRIRQAINLAWVDEAFQISDVSETHLYQTRFIYFHTRHQFESISLPSRVLQKNSMFCFEN